MDRFVVLLTLLDESFLLRIVSVRHAEYIEKRKRRTKRKRRVSSSDNIRLNRLFSFFWFFSFFFLSKRIK